MILDNYGPEVAAQVRARSGNDLVKSEQYLDLISGRTFRQTLLVASERMAAVNRALVPERLADLYMLAPPGMKVETQGKKHSVSDSAGRTLTTTSQLVADGVAWMLARAPSSSSVDECLEATGSSGDDGGARAMLLEALYRMLLAGMITVASEPVSTGSASVDRPRALDLARSDAAAGEVSVTNARHESVSLDPATHVLLPAMDGRNDHKMLVGVLVKAALSGRIAFSRNGIAVTEADAVAEVATSHLPGLIADAANAGLLTSD
jgi:methyltransferase-like protein